MARSNVAGRHVVLVLTPDEAEALDFALMNVLGFKILFGRFGRQRAAVGRVMTALRSARARCSG